MGTECARANAGSQEATATKHTHVKVEAASRAIQGDVVDDVGPVSNALEQGCRLLPVHSDFVHQVVGDVGVGHVRWPSPIHQICRTHQGHRAVAGEEKRVPIDNSVPRVLAQEQAVPPGLVERVILECDVLGTVDKHHAVAGDCPIATAGHLVIGKVRRVRMGKGEARHCDVLCKRRVV